MKIAFCAQNPYWGGLNNNGGSQTIIRSCQTLNEMGHKAVVVTRSDKCTLFKHKKPVSRIPRDTNVCIACSVSDIEPMLRSKPKKARAYYWCRLIENHQMSKRKLLKWARKVNVLVNSTDLYNWFLRHGIDTKVVYQGVDLNKWANHEYRDAVGVGFLVSTKPRKNFKFAIEVVKKLGDRYNYYGYGTDVSRSIRAFIKERFDVFIKNANRRQVCSIYNRVNTWVCTSTKEGLHNPPIEAALCGCAVVYPDAPLAGCSDHCNENTAWKYKALDVDSCVEAIRNADRSKNEAHKKLIIEKIGDRKQSMKHLLEVL